jgi:hypothetical protein
MDPDRDPDGIDKVFLAAQEDVSVLLRELSATDGNAQVRKRAFVRAVFAFIEGMTYALKRIACSRPGLFSAAELAALREETYEVSDKGDARTRRATIEFRRNIRFAFACYARLDGLESVLDLSGTGWQSLREALRVRHRLMHPKAVADFVVTERELDAVRAAYEWFMLSWVTAVARAVGSWGKPPDTRTTPADAAPTTAPRGNGCDEEG